MASATAHGFTAGDIVTIDSGWPALNLAVVRVASSTTDAFALEGFDTTNTTRFPTGSGAGSAREVTAWATISQITDSTVAGGEQQYFQWAYLEDGQQRQRPTFKNARSMTMTMDFDDSLPWHTALLNADRAGTPHVLRIALPNGSTIYYHVFVGFDGEPTLNINANMQVSVSFSFANPLSMRYS
jgi:hypothetical protein